MKWLAAGETRELDVPDAVAAGLSDDYAVKSEGRAAEIAAIIASLGPDDMTAGGKPKLDAINTLMPEDAEPVTAAERDAVMADVG
jgi:hypothetical protein